MNTEQKIAIASQKLAEHGFTLRDYQQEGLRWMLEKEKPTESSITTTTPIYGGILADEMGLGKTLQMISLILAGGNNFGPNLIVVPASLMNQWKSEIKKFTGGTVRAEIAHNSDDNGLLLEFMRCQIYITTYGTVSRNTDKFCDASIKWGRIILDEAHTIRNSKNKCSKAIMSLKGVNKWCITGTPIQNGASDIVTLLEFIGVAKCVAKKQLKTVVEDRMLLRTKKGTGIELPSIVRHNVPIEMSESEFRVYDFVSEYYEFQLVRQLKKRQATILKRMVRDFYNGEGGDVEPEEWHERNLNNYRLEKTLEIANNAGNGVIFADFREEIDFLTKSLESRSFKVGVIHGGIPLVQRKMILETQTEYDFVVIQIYAGGTGLNLQHFNNVIVNSPHWNPFIEEQAIARVHRIGQKRDVNIYHLVEQKTIDAHIVDVQDSKKKIWETVSRGEESESLESF